MKPNMKLVNMMNRMILCLALLICVETIAQQSKMDSLKPGKPAINEALKTELETILKADQHGRVMIDSVQKKFGIESKELLALMESIALNDSINLKKVSSIITRYGWPGKSLAGDNGNRAAFLVIQHAELVAQKKYLPLLKESVTKGESKANHLAFLEDRILMREGKPQVYGTQIISDTATGKWKIYPIEDEKNVDERRSKIGLKPLAEYVKQFGIEYKKEN